MVRTENAAPIRHGQRSAVLPEHQRAFFAHSRALYVPRAHARGGMKAKLVAVLLVWPAWCSGLEPIPLTAWLELPDNERETSYILVRCAGLYLGMLNYAGTDRLGEEISGTYGDAVSRLSATALIVRQQQNPTAPIRDLVVGVARDRVAISNVYSDRMHTNYRARGQAFSQDVEIQSDLQVCQEVVHRLGDPVKVRP